MIPTGVAPAAPEAALFTDAFFVQETGNLEVSVKAPVSNSWLYLDGALINEETGAVDDFDLEVSYYSGSDSDGAWSEGSTRGPHLRRPRSLPGATCCASGRSGRRASLRPPMTSRCAAACRASISSSWPSLALLVWPIVVAWRSMRFESRRWSESDHASSGSSSDDDDDDDSGDDSGDDS